MEPKSKERGTVLLYGDPMPYRVLVYDTATPTVAEWVGAGSVVGGIGNTITVSPDGTADYTTLEDALAYAGTVATVLDRYAVEVYPGAYTENNPLVVPDYVSVIGIGGMVATRIICSNLGANTHCFSLGSHSDIQGLTAYGAGGGGSAGFHFPAGTSNCYVTEVKVEACNRGFYSESAATSNTVQLATLVGNGVTGIEVATGAVLGLSNVYMVGGTWAEGIYCQGTCQINNSFLAGTATGIIVDDAGTVSARLVSISNPTAIGIRVRGTATFRGLSIGVDNSGTYDLQTDANTTTVVINGGNLRSDKLNLAAGTTADHFRAVLYSEAEADEGLDIWGELHVGTPEVPAETALGQGNATTRHMIVLTDDGSGAAWNDITAAVLAGTATNLFQGTGVNQRLLIGNTSRTFPGWKDSITTAAVMGGGAFQVGLSTGAGTFGTVPVLTSNVEHPHTQNAQAIFQIVRESQVRFDPEAAVWVQATYNGTLAYWVEVRIITGAIGTIPVLESADGPGMRLHTDHWEATDDGFHEYFGGAIDQSNLFLTGPYPFTGAGAPGSTTISASAGVGYTKANSAFNKGDGLLWEAPVPLGLDTSRDLTITLLWKPSTNVAGNVHWRAYAVPVEVGNNLPNAGGALAQVTDDQTVASSTVVDNVQAAVTFTLSVPNVLPEELILIAIARINDGLDTTTALAEVVNVSISGYFWH